MWHGVSRMFKSPLALRVQIYESFPDDVPSTADFQVGYLEGNTKRWIVEKGYVQHIEEHCGVMLKF